MYFRVKNTLKNNNNHAHKHPKLSGRLITPSQERLILEQSTLQLKSNLSNTILTR
jgi:hypothetical protein